MVFIFLFVVGVILFFVYGVNVYFDIEYLLMGEIVFVLWNMIMVFGVDIGLKVFWMLVFVLVLNILLISVCYKEFKIVLFDL